MAMMYMILISTGPVNAFVGQLSGDLKMRSIGADTYGFFSYDASSWAET
jgi:hypothetical protein